MNSAESWHIITPEYPPQLGGLSDYTQRIAFGLAEHGDEVHVWCPTHLGPDFHGAAVSVHRSLGTLTLADMLRTGKELDRFPGSRRLLVQWVPHGYGYRSLNVPFCLWLWSRATCCGDKVEIMVHEPYLAFWEGSWKQNLAAVVHRIMTVVLIATARKLWMSIPSWERSLRPYALGRQVPFRWLPIPSNVPVIQDTARTDRVRRRYASANAILIGHFGTHGWPVTSLLEPILMRLADSRAEKVVLLMGIGSREFRQRLIENEPRLSKTIFATGVLGTDDVSAHLAACDVLIQPYRDGVSTRRTTLMAGLSHGKPIVTTSGHLTEPFWTKSGAVALSPAGDTDAFVNSVERLQTDLDERIRLGQAAYEMYARYFDLKHTISTLRGGPAETEQLLRAS